MRILLLAATLALALPCAACLWDYDTLAQESAGMPDVKAVIAGGFPRNPPLYYEMRLERVTKLLAENPDDLDAYDAAAVSCDRLGRSDEAIEWMARKLAAMDRMGYDSAKHEQPNHRYRYLASLGTFHAHRWFKNGANREDMTDMERGRDLIKQAIEENPNAHFGREKYQLRAMEWIISLDPENPPATNHERQKEQTFLGIDPGAQKIVDSDRSVLAKHGLEDAIDGVAGLIILGAAWESIDVFKALALALALDGRTLFARLADARAWEIGNAGGDTVLPRSWLAKEEGVELRPKTWMNLYSYSPGDTMSDLEAGYVEWRQTAESWHWMRTTYLLANLQRGNHPDTDPDFWSGFDGDPNRMPIPDQRLEVWADDTFGWLWRPGGIVILVLLVLVGIGAVTAIGTGFIVVARFRAKRQQRATPA